MFNADLHPQASSRARGEEAARLQSQLRAEREERRSGRQEADDLRRQVELLSEELRVARGDANAAKVRP